MWCRARACSQCIKMQSIFQYSLCNLITDNGLDKKARARLLQVFNFDYGRSIGVCEFYWNQKINFPYRKSLRRWWRWKIREPIFIWLGFSQAFSSVHDLTVKTVLNKSISSETKAFRLTRKQNLYCWNLMLRSIKIQKFPIHKIFEDKKMAKKSDWKIKEYW